MPDRELETTLFKLAHLFARAHGRGGIVFWTSETGWRDTHAVSVRRTDPEHVMISVRTVGHGGLYA